MGPRRHHCFLFVLLAATLGGAAPATADEAPTRAEEWARMRREKAAEVAPPEPNKVHRAFLWMRESKLLERLSIPGAGWRGFRPAFGGLPTGAGFGGGLRWDRMEMAGDQLDLHAEILGSITAYQLYSVSAELPRLADERVAAGGFAHYQNRPREEFYGLGPDADDVDSNYLYEETSLGVAGSVTPGRYLTIGGDVSWAGINVGRGREPGSPSVDELFDDSEAPGLDEQTDYARMRAWVTLSSLDSEGFPRSGTWLRAGYERHDDIDVDRYDFDRWELEVRQFIPFNHGHRVIALRALTSWDDAGAGDRVPFYLQKTLGGSSSLRGFEDFRFRDTRQILLNAEYRWEIWGGLDGAFFYDAGKVFSDGDDFDLDDLEDSYGGGLRFHTAVGTFLRFDLGHGREGTRLQFKFQRVFE